VRRDLSTVRGEPVLARFVDGYTGAGLGFNLKVDGNVRAMSATNLAGSENVGADAHLARMKAKVRTIAASYPDREQRARRLFIEERAAAFAATGHLEKEFKIKTEISEFFGIPYSAVCFCGSAQLGFSAHKDRLFAPAVSDLDAACVSSLVFQKAWADVIDSTSAFTDLAVFGSRGAGEVDLFKDQILRRGMIRVEMMPKSRLSKEWGSFQGDLSRRYTDLFKKVTITIYMNEYAFCWKQDSALREIIG